MINPGFGWRKRISGLLANGLRYRWICSAPDMAEDTPHSIKFDDTVLTHLQSQFKSLAALELEDLLIRIRKKLGRCPMKGVDSDEDDNTTFTVIPKLHSEAALVSYLAAVQTGKAPTYIATAHPACYVCHVFMEAMWTTDVSFPLIRHDGVLDCGWRLPNLPSDQAENVKRIMTKKLGQTLDLAVEGFKKRRRPVSRSIEW